MMPVTIDRQAAFAACIEIMKQDLAYFEAKYQGRFAEEPHVGLGNRKTRCVNEAYARSLGFNVTHVVWDGSGNCPYQHSLAKFNLQAEGKTREERLREMTGYVYGA